ncbi:MAG: ATP-dependent Clp protease ATP-binding subunit ClpB, partial [Candidatus Berkelbacteria bacterium Athens1014_28]
MAQEKALSYNQQQVDVLHLLVVLIGQNDSVVPVVFRKMEINIEELSIWLTGEIEKLPKAPGGIIGQIFVSQMLVEVLDQAEKEMRIIKDEFISTEHLLLAILAVGNTAGKELERRGVS